MGIASALACKLFQSRFAGLGMERASVGASYRYRGTRREWYRSLQHSMERSMQRSLIHTIDN